MSPQVWAKKRGTVILWISMILGKRGTVAPEISRKSGSAAGQPQILILPHSPSPHSLLLWSSSTSPPSLSDPLLPLSASLMLPHPPSPSLYSSGREKKEKMRRGRMGKDEGSGEGKERRRRWRMMKGQGSREGKESKGREERKSWKSYFLGNLVFLIEFTVLWVTITWSKLVGRPMY